MKKSLIFLLVIITLLFTGCDLKKNNDSNVSSGKNEKTQPTEKKYEEKKDGIVIEYTITVNGGSIEEVENYRYIRLTADKKITWGRNKSGQEGSKELKQEEYNDIINLAFVESFKKIGNDISDKEVLDGSSQYVTVYYADGTSFRTGGLNPNNEKFKKLIDKLNSYAK